MNIGANLGMEIARTLAHKNNTGGGPQVAEAPEIQSGVPATARIVLMEFPGNRTGLYGRNITVSAHTPCIGKIMIGPEMGPRDVTGSREFQRELSVAVLKMAPFRVNAKTGLLRSRGSLVAEVPGNYVCPACSTIYAFNNKQIKELLKIGKGKLYCNKEGCVHNLTWRRSPRTMPSPEDASVQAMRHEYMTAEPVLRETMIPRIWAVFDIDRAPVEWAPSKSDVKAQEIYQRSHESGRTIIPCRDYIALCAERSNSKQASMPGFRGLISETTLDSNGVPGPAVGFVRPEFLYPPADAADSLLGYTVRFGKKPRGAARRMRATV